MRNLQRKIGRKFLWKFPKILLGLLGQKTTKFPPILFSMNVIVFPREDKTYLLMGENGTFLWETITDCDGNSAGTHLNLSDGFPDFLDRYFKRIFLIKNKRIFHILYFWKGNPKRLSFFVFI